MARIKHIAIRTNDVEKTAKFYQAAFGLDRVGTGQSGIYLTDGHLNIAILNFRAVVEGESMSSASTTWVFKLTTLTPPSHESKNSVENH